MTTAKTNENTEQQEPEIEIILAGEESTTFKKRTSDGYQDDSKLTDAQILAKQMMQGFESGLDQEIDDLGIRDGDDELEDGFVNMDELQSQFDSIIEQSTDHSSKIADSIKVSDLGETGSDLLMEGYKAIEKISMDKSWTERAINRVPIPFVRKKLQDGFQVAELETKRNSSVKEYAEAHFEALNKQKIHVNNNRVAVDEIRQKLEDSGQILEKMLGDARKGLKQIERTGGSKREEIRGKELMINIGTQIKAQSGIIEQAEMFESVANIVSEKITSTLPQIKDQFINQVSVTASLKNLANLQKSVEATKDMVLKMQNDVLDQANEVYDVYQKTGLGESAAQKKLSKDADEKMKNLRVKRGNISKQHEEDVEARFKVLDRELLEGKKHITKSKNL